MLLGHRKPGGGAHLPATAYFMHCEVAVEIAESRYFPIVYDPEIIACKRILADPGLKGIASCDPVPKVPRRSPER
jgi:hypothetical protein